MGAILNFLVNKWNEFTEFITNAIIFLLNKLLIWLLDFMIFTADFAFNVFSTTVNGLTLDTQLNTYVTQLHPSIGYVFDALNIATYIQIVISAYITVLVLRFTIPFYK